MYKLTDTPIHRESIKQLLEGHYYIGTLSSRGFIIKRNFGIRRLVLYGEFKSKGIHIQAKNELFHQVFLIIGVVLILALIGISLYQKLYVVAFFLSIILIFIILDNRRRVQKEYELLEETLEKLELDTPNRSN